VDGAPLVGAGIAAETGVVDYALACTGADAPSGALNRAIASLRIDWDDADESALADALLTHVAGDLLLAGGAATELVLPALLAGVGGNVVVENNANATLIDLGALTDVGGSLSIEQNGTADGAPSLALVASPALVVHGDLGIVNNAMTDAEAQAFADSITVEGTTTITGNVQ
jgi:hypothetical protein